MILTTLIFTAYMVVSNMTIAEYGGRSFTGVIQSVTGFCRDNRLCDDTAEVQWPDGSVQTVTLSRSLVGHATPGAAITVKTSDGILSPAWGWLSTPLRNDQRLTVLSVLSSLLMAALILALSSRFLLPRG
tara:strand:+ start:123 stop:512 length:390 start_codon:yes stop_codon:yes gene_type:complete